MRLTGPRSALYRWLCRSRRSRWRVVRRLHPWCWAAVARGGGPVLADLHGARLWVPAGDRRPLWAAELPTLGTPVVVGLHLAAMARRGTAGLGVVDVGAATGDTAALVLDTGLPVDRLCCVEGHPRFAELLVRNLSERLGPRHPTCAMAAVGAVLADTECDVAALVVGDHGGTAAVGTPTAATVAALPLDAVVPPRWGVDVLKVDTDGFDGRVLAGATRILATDHPVVVFEWSPIQLADVGADPRQPFDVLAAHGYREFLLYTKEGRYREALTVGQLDRLVPLEAALTSTRGRADDYLDVVAR